MNLARANCLYKEQKQKNENFQIEGLITLMGSHSLYQKDSLDSFIMQNNHEKCIKIKEIRISENLYN